MPEWLVLTLAMLAACAVVVIITFVRHRAAPEDEDPNETPDVIEYMTMWIGVVYAIVLGLAIAGVWEARSAAQDHVQAEARRCTRSRSGCGSIRPTSVTGFGTMSTPMSDRSSTPSGRRWPTTAGLT